MKTPTPAELGILKVVWRLGSATVRQIHDELAREHPSGYTTTLKLIQIMTGKGLLVREQQERTHWYHAAEDRLATERRLAGEVLDKVFGGSASQLLVGALSHRKTPRHELQEIRRLLDEYERKSR